jgi:D-allulose-6-phosphate 3-epimerase
MKLDRSGLPIYLDEASSRLTFTDGLVCEEISAKSTAKLSSVLACPEAGNDETAFDFYKNVHFPKDEALFAKHRLRFDITVVHPGLVGDERKKTTGHIHARMPGKTTPHAELYEVLAGTALYLLQPDRGPDGPTELIAVLLNAGDRIVVPANCAHCTVNAGEGTLVFDNLVLESGANDYGVVQAHSGMAAFLVARGAALSLVPNPRYDAATTVYQSGTVAQSAAFGTAGLLPTYLGFLAGPETYRYLQDPTAYNDAISALIKTEPLSLPVSLAALNATAQPAERRAPMTAHRMQFSPSLMCMDTLHVQAQLAVLDPRCDIYHVDIMDGNYVKNFACSIDFVKAIKPHTTKPIDMHLMVLHPADYLVSCAKAGADYISPHMDTITRDAFRTLDTIRALGCKTGVVLNPADSLESIRHYIGRLDKITLLTVDPGYAGQKFVPEVLDKVRQLVALRDELGLSFLIEIDGGCNEKSYRWLRDAGADVLIVGSSGLFNLDADLAVAWDRMMMQYAQAVR